MSLAQLLLGKRVVICAGSGGVGKTTTAAAVALGLAGRGARVAVVTIDPARRLADALGLDVLDNEPRLIDPARLGGLGGLRASGRGGPGDASGSGGPGDASGSGGPGDASGSAGPGGRGELWAMTLDPKRTFDELIELLAPSPDRARQVKANRIYRRLSSAVAGLQEFTAVAKLHELSRSERFDVVVLDTPPSRNAIDFLSAPERLQSFLDGRALRAFTRPTGLGLRMLALGTAPLLAALRRVTGIDVIGELTTFFSLLGGMTESFATQAREVAELLRAPATAFLIVTSPQARPVAEAIWFRDALAQRRLPFVATIVNRVHPPLGTAAAGWAANGSVPAPLQRKLAVTLEEYRVLERRDASNVKALREALGGEPILLLDELNGEMMDITGVLRLGAELFER